jgi:DNA polymerase-1
VTELIVDGNGLACRLWWANPGNVPARFLKTILDTRPESGCAVRVAWDSKEGSWRRDLLPTYKANRGPKPQALVKALEMCRGVYIQSAWDAEAPPGFEADDLIAAECRRALAAGAFVVIMSDDKDMAQLVGPKCLWFAGGKIYNEAAVIAKFGVPPGRIRHLLSWTGDKVDGLPGVPGYGPKRAVPRALAGEIGNQMTYDLTELVHP